MHQDEVTSGEHAFALALSHEVIGAAIEVHRLLGPGLLESVYEAALSRELTLRNWWRGRWISSNEQPRRDCFGRALNGRRLSPPSATFIGMSWTKISPP